MGSVTTAQHGQLVIRTSFNPFQWGLFFGRPWIDLNGHVSPGKWGDNYFDLPPGRYVIRVTAPMFFIKTAGLGQMQVDIPAGVVTYLRYHAPFLLLLTGGDLTGVSQHPMQALPPG